MVRTNFTNLIFPLTNYAYPAERRPKRSIYISSNRLIAGADGETVSRRNWRNGVIWWIQSVYVRAENRRQGVYTALYENARKSARESGDVAAIRLYVEKDNDVAQQTYSKLGMKETYYRIFETASV